eukprot:s399_g3.t1
MAASRQGHIEVVQAGADKNLADDGGFTALITASGRGHVEAVRMLLDAGANKSLASSHGLTALMVASLPGHVEVLRVLLDAGAETNSASNDGFTALMPAPTKTRPAATESRL